MAGEPNPSSTVLDLYKVAVEQADRVSARRATANSYFLTINTGLAAFVGVLGAPSATRSTALPRPDDVALAATAAVGAILSATWWLLLRSYRDLNRAKFKVILEIEEAHLPVKIFDREWKVLKDEEPLPWWKGRYAELGFVERVVPTLFLGVYVFLGARSLLS